MLQIGTVRSTTDTIQECAVRGILLGGHTASGLQTLAKKERGESAPAHRSKIILHRKLKKPGEGKSGKKKNCDRLRTKNQPGIKKRNLN